MEKQILKDIIIDQADFQISPDWIKRDAFDKITKFHQDPTISVITGLRRCGKSTLLKQIRDIYNGFYLNFDDDRLTSFKVEDFQSLFECFIELFGNYDVFYFDEIQVIEGWERFVRRLYDSGKKVYISGSNATLLSRELGTRLTGRHILFTLYPFSFNEYLKLLYPQYSALENYTTVDKGLIKKYLSEYLINGGIPDFLKYQNVDYLKTLVDNILYRDIIVRYGLTNAKSMKELSSYLFSNFCGKISYNKLKDLIEVKNGTTVKNFLDFLENSYLINTINKFDYSLKNQVKANKKCYIIDSAIPNLIGFKFSENKGRLLENLIYWELKKKFNAVYYYEEKGECDFLVKSIDNKYSAYQICHELNDENKKREFNGLISVMNEFGLDEGYIITFDDEFTEKIENKLIRVVPAWKWLKR